MRRWGAITLLVVVLALLAWPEADARYLGSDVMGNIAPSSHIGGLADQYPLSAYSLDYHVDVGVTNLDGVPPTIAQWASAQVWMVVSWLLKLTLDLFGWAFSLDLLGGPNGALGPVGHAVRSVYDNVIGRTWLTVAFAAAGIWAIWKALVQRRYSETAGAMALSALCIMIGWWIIFQPVESIGTMSRWGNDMSTSFLSATNRGTVTDGEQAKRQVSDHLFETLVFRPWVALEFGGLRHCVDTRIVDKNGYPRPVSTDDPRRTVCRDHIHKTPSGYGGYAYWYLESPIGSDDRNRAYEALRDGEKPEYNPTGLYIGPTKPVDPLADARVDKNDSPAVDIQQAGGAFQRLALTALIAVGAAGAIGFLGFLALAIVLAQILALVLFAFAPVAVIIGIFPGAGHRFFRNWLGRLGVALFIKAIYSLALGVTVVVSAALADVTDQMTFGLAFLLQAAFFWALLLGRKSVTRGVLRSAVGHRVTERIPTNVRTTGERAITAPIATMAGAATASHHEMRREGPEDRTTGPAAATAGKDAPGQGGDHRHPADSSSPPASAGRDYSPPGPPNQTRPTNPTTATNGNVTTNDEEVTMPGGRVPPRPGKRHIQASERIDSPGDAIATQNQYDQDRDTSTENPIQMQIRHQNGTTVPVRVHREWPDIASAHATDDTPPIPERPTT